MKKKKKCVKIAIGQEKQRTNSSLISYEMIINGRYL